MAYKVFTDLETGGFDEEKNPVLQIGYVIEKDGEKVFETEYKLSPGMKKTNSKALRYAGISVEDHVKNGIKQKVARNKVIRDLKLRTDYPREYPMLVCHNKMFDEVFLREFFNDKDYPFYPNSICTLSMAVVLNSEKIVDFRNNKLTTIAKHYGVEVDEEKTHTALYDAKLCRKIYYKMINEIE